MDIVEGRALRKLLLERYTKSPKNWSFTVAPAVKDGFYDALFSSPNESWQIKIDSIFKPSPFMIGTKVDVNTSRLPNSGSIPYGYRSLDRELLVKILAAIDENEPRNSPSLESILGPLEPVVPKRTGSYAQGPFVFTNERISHKLSTGQEHLDDRLSAELRKLLWNRYSSYA